MHHSARGFTLIELSIVLVIIGLVVGGVLAGRDLIRAAGERAMIAQIEKYNTAANTFRGKYGYLPGDIPQAPATQFGFHTRLGTVGDGDGNGIIEGYSFAQSTAYDWAFDGEPSLFWEDLSSAHLIDGTFNTATNTSTMPVIYPTSKPSFDAYTPAAKIGNGNYVYPYVLCTHNNYNTAVQNYFGVSAITILSASITSNVGMTVQQAYDIDRKVDDGLPQYGNVVALYTTGGQCPLWASVGAGPADYGVPYTNATSGSSSTCYDNNNVAGVNQQYSVEQGGGSNVNCALSFRMQ